MGDASEKNMFFLQPGFILTTLAGTIGTAVIVTLWITSAIGDVDRLASENKADIKHAREMQAEQTTNIKDSVEDLKSSTERQYQNLDRKLDKLIDHQIKSGGH